MNSATLALDNLERFGEYPALQFAGSAYTNVELDDYAGRLATVLQARGVEAGDRVLVQMANCPEVMASFQAVWKIGGVLLPAPPQLGAAEVGYLLENSETKVALTNADLAPRLEQAAAAGPSCEQILVFGESEVAGAPDITEAVASAPPIRALTARASDDLALLLYTSGTTGKPKGVMLSHENVVSLPHPAVADLPPLMPTLHVLPLSHSFGVLMMNLGLVKGMRALLHTQWRVESVFEAIRDFEVQRFAVVPTMMTYMLDFPERESYDTSSLEGVWSGGAPLPDELRREFERVFACEVRDGYGMTESMGAATTYWQGDAFRPGSVGRAMPTMSIDIVDEQGRRLEAGAHGEVLIAGPTVMSGYWRNEEATAATVKDGWLHSGDVGYLDEDGFLYITDRKKDLIIKGGENISPREIEEALYSHHCVSEAVVVGIPHPRYGEDIWAAVALRPGAEASEEELRAHVAAHVIKFKVPTRVVFFTELPKNNTGKLQKREVRERLLASERE